MHDREIQSALRGLKGRGRLDEKKLGALLERTGILAPAPSLHPVHALQRIRAGAAEAGPSLSLMDLFRTYRSMAALVSACLVIAVVLFWSLAPSPTSGIAVLSLEGQVKVMRGDVPLSPDRSMEPVEGDVIETGKGGVLLLEATLGTHGRVQVRAGEESRVILSRVRLAGGEISFIITLERGSTVLRVDRLTAGDTVAVRTADSLAEVRGTLFGAAVMENGDTVYEVFQGKVRMRRRVPDSSGLDKKTERMIEDELERRGVIIGVMQSCRVKESLSLYRQIHEGNYRAKIAAMQEPAVKDMRGGDMILALPMEELAGGPVDGDYDAKKSGADHRQGRQNSTKRKILRHIPAAEIGPASFILHVQKNNSYCIVGRKGYVSMSGATGIQSAMNLDMDISLKPLMTGETMYVAGDNGFIVAIDAGRGVMVWKKRPFEAPEKPVLMLKEDTSLYVLTRSGTLVRLDADGEVLWKNSATEDPVSSLLVSEHMVFVPGKKGILVGFDRRRGIKVFRKHFDAAVTAAEITGSRMYLLTGAGAVICYDFRRDEKQWVLDLHETLYPFVMVENGSMYVFSESGKITKISSSGEVLWSSNLGNAITRDPVQDGRRLYVLCDESFYVLKKDNGILLWSMVTPPVITANIALSGDNVYFAARKKGVVILKK